MASLTTPNPARTPHLAVSVSGAGHGRAARTRLTHGAVVSGRTADAAPLHAQPEVQVGPRLGRPPLGLDLLLSVIGDVVTLPSERRERERVDEACGCTACVYRERLVCMEVECFQVRSSSIGTFTGSRNVMYRYTRELQMGIFYVKHILARANCMSECEKVGGCNQ